MASAVSKLRTGMGRYGATRFGTYEVHFQQLSNYRGVCDRSSWEEIMFFLGTVLRSIASIDLNL